MSSTRRPGPLIVAVATLAGFLGACADPPAAPSVAAPAPVAGLPDSADGTRATRLPLSDGEPVGKPAPLSGRLGVDAKGCVTLGRYALLAPHGSWLHPDGTTLTLNGLGEFVLGQEVSGTVGTVIDSDGSCASADVVDVARGAGPEAVPPDKIECASGYSNGRIVDYFTDGGEATATEAISDAEPANQGSPLRQRLVENTVDRVRVGFLDEDGTMTANATVVRVDGKWQIVGSSECAPAGSVAPQ